MALASTNTWTPSAYEMIVEAMERCGLNKESDSVVHLKSAVRSLNFIQTEFASSKAYLPTIKDYEFDTEVGRRDYELPIGITDIITATALYDETDVPIRQMSYEEFSRIPDKDYEDRPYRYLFDRGAEVEGERAPRMRFYYKPDDVYTIRLQAQFRPADIPHARFNIETASRWYEAFVSVLAFKLAQKFAPDRIEPFKMLADEAVRTARAMDVTYRPIRLKPKGIF